EPSPFCHEILNANPYAYLDDAPLEERRTRAVQMRRTLPADFADGASKLEPAAIVQVAAEAWPPMRDPDELHEGLCSLSLLPANESTLFPRLVEQNRATTLTVDGRQFWVPAERLDLVRGAYPGATIDPEIAPANSRPVPENREACAAEIL